MIFEKYINPLLLSKKSFQISPRFRIFLVIAAILIVAIFVSIETLFDLSVKRLCGEELGLDLSICYLKRAPLVEPEKSLEDHLVNIEYELTYSLYQDNVETILLDVPSKFGNLKTHVVRSIRRHLSSSSLTSLPVNSSCSTQQECSDSPQHNDATSTKLDNTNPKTLLLLHGYGTTSIFAWRYIFSDLMTHYDTVIALDLPGFGRSKMSDAVFDPEVDHAATTELYCEWLGNTQQLLNLTSPPYIVGHSFGGYLTTQCVSRKPALASRVLIADSPGMFSANGDYTYLFFQFFRYSFPYSVVRALGKYYTNKILDFTAYVLNTQQNPLHRDYWLHLQLSPTLRAGEILSKLLSVEGFTAIGKGMALASLLNISVPVTLVFGEKDIVSPPSHGEFMSELGGYELIVIKNGSHCPYQHADREAFVQVKLMRVLYDLIMKHSLSKFTLNTYLFL